MSPISPILSIYNITALSSKFFGDLCAFYVINENFKNEVFTSINGKGFRCHYQLPRSQNATICCASFRPRRTFTLRDFRFYFSICAGKRGLLVGRQTDNLRPSVCWEVNTEGLGE